MLPKLQFHLTNWIDGMKINRQHFSNSENALLDHVRDLSAICVNANSYGLLSPEPGEKSALDCSVQSSQSKKFKISVSLCRAITVGGCRIEIIPGSDPELVSDNEIFITATSNIDERKKNSTPFLAIISVDPFTRLPFGDPAADEYPPRNPFGINTYKLNIIAEDSLNTTSMGAYHFPIARFNVKNDELVRDNTYIPPCAFVNAHPATRQIYNFIGEYFTKIQDYCTEIIQKTFIDGQNTQLAANIRRVCESNLRHISSEFFLFRTMYPKQSPVYLANAMVQLANAIKISINIISDKEKEEMLQHFREMNDISPTRFEEMIGNAIDVTYVHDDIYGSFQPLINFMNMWSDLLEKLKDLKLINRRNEKFDVGPQRTIETQKDKGKKFSIFD